MFLLFGTSLHLLVLGGLVLLEHMHGYICAYTYSLSHDLFVYTPRCAHGVPMLVYIYLYLHLHLSLYVYISTAISLQLYLSA